MGLKFQRFDSIRKLILFNFFFSLVFLSPVIVFFYQSRGLNLSQIFLLESCLILASLLLEVPTGVFADRYGRRLAMVLGGGLLLLEPIIFIFAYGLWPFIIAAVLYGIGTAFISGCAEAIIYETLEKEGRVREMARAIGSWGAAGLIAAAIAPVVGSWIAERLTNQDYLLLIYMTIAAGMIGWVITTTLHNVDHISSGPQEGLRQVLSKLWSNQPLAKIAILEVITNPLVFVAVYLGQPYFASAHVPIGALGLIFTAGLLLDAALRQVAHPIKQRLGLRIGLFMALILPGVLYLALAYSNSAMWIVASFIILRGVMGLRTPLLAEYKNRLIPNVRRATLLSIISMAVAAFEAVIIFALGQIADLDISLVFKILGGILIAGAIGFIFIIKSDPQSGSQHPLAQDGALRVGQG